MDDQAMAAVLAGLPASSAKKSTGTLTGGPDSRDFVRDGRGRPYVVTPAGKTTTYTRCTTYIGVLDDKSNLEAWKMRTLIGWAFGTPKENRGATWDSLYREARAGMADNRLANSLIYRALGEAGSKDKATAGTAVHTLTQRSDEGVYLGAAVEASPHLAAYRALTAGWWHLLIEHPVVCDDLKVAGTPDRISDTKDPCPECGMTIRVCDVKGLALDTPLPTPTGWTTMGAVAVGDQVLGSDGKPCTVTLKSEVKRIGTYIVTFDDGSQVTCDREHLWWVHYGPAPKGEFGEERVMGVEEIRKELAFLGGSTHRVLNAAPLELPEADLPINPYLLGTWLGDGSKNRSVITKTDDLFEALEEEGVDLGVRQVDKRSGVVTRTAIGLRAQLKALDLLGNKHIPMMYLRASRAQRLSLLRGLMDTDGTWNKARNSAVFSSTNSRLSADVSELLASLGQRPYESHVKTRGFGKEVIDHRVSFSPLDMNPFRIARKADRVIPGGIKSRRRMINSVEPGPDVETQCIAVDSPNHTYLCTKKMIPTHNTGRVDKYTEREQAMQLSIYAHSDAYDTATEERTPLSVCLHEGIIIHLPIDSDDPVRDSSLIRIDIARGWELVQVARAVHDARKVKGLLSPWVR
jgi:LAGLIDADG-like domain